MTILINKKIRRWKIDNSGVNYIRTMGKSWWSLRCSILSIIQEYEFEFKALISVSKDFPIGAKIKFRNGRKQVDSRHLEKSDFDDIDEKLELKVRKYSKKV